MDYSAFHWSEKARKYAETLGTIFNVKGRVNTVADLPSTGNKIGDVYLVGLTTDTDLSEYAWLSFDNVTRWEKLGSTATSLAFSAITGSPNDNVALKNALDGKYDANNPNGYTSNVGTVTSVNNTSPDANGNVTITIPDPLPSQTGQNGKYLTTNGTSASWGSVDALPSQTGNNGKFLTTNGTSASWGAPSSFKLFHHDWFDYELNDMAWLRADTFSWQDGTVYSNAYNHLVADYNGGTSQTETVGSYTITYVLATDGHKITTDETTATNIYNESGVAWYYILDTANQRFKLPRENPNKKELKVSAPVMADHTKTTRLMAIKTGGALFRTELYDHTPGSVGSDNALYTINTVESPTSDFDTHLYSNLNEGQGVYQGKKYLYFYVGQFSQSATEQTAGLNASLFNGKLDLDLGNITSTSKEAIIGLGMPDLTTQTAISTTVNQVQQANKNIFLQILPNASDTDGVKSNRVAICDSSGNNSVEVLRSYTGWDGGLSSVGIYIKKGQYFKVTNWNISGSLVKYYLVGEI